jgi:hypothetical protein
VNGNVQKAVSVFSLGTVRSLQPLKRQGEEALVHLLKRMQQFYTIHGLNLRTMYEDFDKHHMGIVTESQVSGSVCVCKCEATVVLQSLKSYVIVSHCHIFPTVSHFKIYLL